MSRQNWHPEQIKAEVRMRTGKSLSQLSLDNDLPEHACRTALYRTCHIEAELVIAEILGLSAREIWPSRFRQDGGRIHPPRHKVKATTPPSRGNDQLHEAA